MNVSQRLFLDNPISISAVVAYRADCFFSVFLLLTRPIYAYALFNSGLPDSNKDYNITRHQSMRCRHSPIGSLLDTNPQIV